MATAAQGTARAGARRPVTAAARLTNKTAPTFARYTVEVAGEGSYADVHAFVERLEQNNPYCGVTDLTIRPLPASPESHRVTMMLEWPVLSDPPQVVDTTRR